MGEPNLNICRSFHENTAISCCFKNVFYGIKEIAQVPLLKLLFKVYTMHIQTNVYHIT